MDFGSSTSYLVTMIYIATVAGTKYWWIVYIRRQKESRLRRPNKHYWMALSGGAV